METTGLNASAAADHLCVLVHGLWGNPKHLGYLASALRERYPQDVLHVLVAKRNSGSFTYDGIETGAERVTQEIEDTIEELARNGQTIKKLSIVGYSLGGLVARYVVGLLYSKGWFDKLEPVNFTTFATPHLGVRTPLTGFHNHVWNILGARTLSTSGRQLFTIDSFRDTGRPLLAVLADPSSIFIKALASFKHRSLYSNITNDRSAVFYTTCISKTDPFVDLSAIKLNYLPGYQDVLVDPDNPLSPKPSESDLPLYHRISATTRNTLSKIPLFAALVVFIPLGVTAFLINSGIQSIRSAQRIRLHEAGLGAGHYRIPLLIEDARRMGEGVYEGFGGAQSQEYLPAGSEETSSPLSFSRKRSHRSDSMASESTEKLLGTGGNDSNTQLPNSLHSRPLDFPTLALTKDQFDMVDALDEVGWRKYPVHIHKVGHTHAAIIVRMNRKSFAEGKIVVGHWLDEFDI
ncbi:hypothetical protein B0A49_06939 [Cryomyces minteri]|uniref:DUF676 domain-containing protein n=1 Tax=Cryomyces minteri TaxID=331657 RepID=A0A4V5NFD0_9PEZI|nr:hypothetical protein B0A49_06939 [Cryomyces minteri]